MEFRQVLNRHVELRFPPPDIVKNLEFILEPDTPSVQTFRAWIIKSSQRK
jgi:hypothetical protein